MLNLTSLRIYPNPPTSLFYLLVSKVLNNNCLKIYNCTSLTSIEIPESVTTIGEYAFWDCTNLKTAHVPVSLKGMVESAFPETCEIEWY